MEVREYVSGKPLVLMSLKTFESADWETKHFLVRSPVANRDESVVFCLIDICYNDAMRATLAMHALDGSNARYSRETLKTMSQRKTYMDCHYESACCTLRVFACASLFFNTLPTHI